MSSQSTTFSFRLPHEDVEFINRLKISGAKTPSEKFRAIIAEAKNKNIKSRDYHGCMQIVKGMMADTIEDIRQAELENKMHSELITRAFEWLPEIIAFVVSAINEEDKGGAEALLELESGFADRLFQQIESVLQLGSIRNCRCYDPDTISKRLKPVIELTNIVSNVHRLNQEDLS